MISSGPLVTLDPRRTLLTVGSSIIIRLVKTKHVRKSTRIFNETLLIFFWKKFYLLLCRVRSGESDWRRGRRNGGRWMSSLPCTDREWVVRRLKVRCRLIDWLIDWMLGRDAIPFVSQVRSMTNFKPFEKNMQRFCRRRRNRTLEKTDLRWWDVHVEEVAMVILHNEDGTAEKSIILITSEITTIFATVFFMKDCYFASKFLMRWTSDTFSNSFWNFLKFFWNFLKFLKFLK